MTMFWISLVTLFIFMTLMALGVLFSNKPLKGSCGGMGNVMDEDCEFCDYKGRCTNENAQSSE